LRKQIFRNSSFFIFNSSLYLPFFPSAEGWIAVIFRKTGWLGADCLLRAGMETRPYGVGVSLP